jgi:hypothetical protein
MRLVDHQGMRKIAISIFKRVALAVDFNVPMFDVLTQAIAWRQAQLLTGVLHRFAIDILGVMLNIQQHTSLGLKSAAIVSAQ